MTKIPWKISEEEFKRLREVNMLGEVYYVYTRKVRKFTR